MNFRRIHIVLGSLILICFSVSFNTMLIDSAQVSVVLKSKKEIYTAGEEIQLNFELNTPVSTQLFLHSSFGNILLQSENGQFILPKFLSNNKGVIQYTLLHDSEQLLSGIIKVLANTNTKVQLESYIGPPSITAGGNDYTMPVIIPADIYDNPLPDSTEIVLKHQFLSNEKEEIVYTKDLIGWSTIFSYEQSGRLLLSSKVKETSSKEFSIVVFPAIPESFQINAKRKHEYADGNQIAELITSTLNDQYGNIISDGTLVTFQIKNKKGVLLKTQASTVRGIAIAKMLHPDHEDSWEIKAFVSGIAESDTIHIEYESVLDDFKVQFSENNREIIVGPLVSFMEQLIPDGATVVLRISQEDNLIDTKMTTSSNGVVTFKVSEGFYANGNYNLKIKVLGVEKQYENILMQ
ncbi:hypothetical protein [uncultured Aquimarina sp.]|uniref:hypothetical protein n=1 Tax=uncultured Aquimarina sp. TaxID=575652 RepID=UPI00262B7A1B|nr:hypothetical protein [uncultured Aquimarina sp.]